MIFLQDPDPKTRKVDDIDFFFVNGDFQSWTLDQEAGDTKEHPTPDTIVLHFAPKLDEESLLSTPPEDVTIFVKNLTHIKHRVREVTDLTNSQREQWKKTLHEVSPIVQ
jgi:hypothetical protein